MAAQTLQVIVFLLCLQSLFGFQSAALAQIIPPSSHRQRLASTDVAALYSLRSSLGLRSQHWPRKGDPCTAWIGVQCRGGRVVALKLAGLRRTKAGRLNPRFAVDGIQNLTRLAVFNASGFALPGSIPDWLGPRLSASLTILDLSSSYVSGAIPSSLGNAAGLTELHVSGNSLSGSIPSALGNMSGLLVLDLSCNVLSGPIPASLLSLQNLTFLDLSSNSLSGAIPLELGMLYSLRTLRISNNNLLGPVPPQLGDLSSLLALNLGHNSLSGSIPEELKNLRSLQELDVKNNSLSGLLPGDLFRRLLRLRTLILSRNNFSGALPDSLWSLSDLWSVDVSYNSFSGRLPDVQGKTNISFGILDISHNSYYGAIPVGERNPLQRFGFVGVSDNYFQGEAPAGLNSSFELNCFSNAPSQRSSESCTKFYADRGLPYDGPVTNSNTTILSNDSGGKSNRQQKYILAGVLGGTGFVVILVVVIGCYVMRQGATSTEEREIIGSGDKLEINAASVGIPVSLSSVGDSFTYEQLLLATSHFSEANIIKNGHSGELYHGTLESGTPVVVKRINLQSAKKDSYLVELEFFSKASHIRLIPFMGHCLEKTDEKLLVYKYMPNGDLSNSLYRKLVDVEKSLQSLDWITRLKIATGVAEALCYLHHECSPPFIHRDIQASSILLDDQFEVRVGSLSEICTQDGDQHQKVINRFLRKATEHGTPGTISASCTYDIYCFGKVLLGLVTGELGFSGSNDASTNEWLEQTLPFINTYEKEFLMNILDPSLVVDDDLLEEVWAMAIVAKSCLNPKPSRRPPIVYILKALEDPLRVVRKEHLGSPHLRTMSSRGSWNASFFGSWRHSSSDIASVPGATKEPASFKYSAAAGSQGSISDQSFNHKRLHNEIFPYLAVNEHSIVE